MSLITFEAFLSFSAVVFTAMAVKLADDLLDKEHDLACGRRNWADMLGQSAAIYALLFLALGAGADAAVSLPLFFASYCVGMFAGPDALLPSRLKGWQETILVLAFSLAMFGWRRTLFSCLLILAVQLFDDCIDKYSDRRSGQRNFAERFGGLECFLAGVAAVLFAWQADSELFIPALTGAGAAYGVLFFLQGDGLR